ncbi:MAG: uL15 family ribosomal protein [Patescibacteria group bacterium]|jgi:large subunit ribosomal protein L15
MVSLHSLPKTTAKPKKRLGRGYGSGKGGHTSSRGQKGQKSRSTVGLFFTGTKSNKDFFRRTPMLRGKGKLKSYQGKPVLVKSSALAAFKDGTVVDVKALVNAGIVTQEEVDVRGVKVVFDKDPGKKIDLKVPASKTVYATVKA